MLANPSFETTQGLSELILVVDDESAIRETICGVFEDENYQTVTAADGVEALEQVKKFKPSLVFLDIWMPGMDGIEALDNILKISPKTKVVMISGHATISNALEATKRGAFDFIEKPLELDGIISVAQKAMNSIKRGNASIAKNGSIYQHRGILSQGMAGSNVGQRTISSNILLSGQGLHSGKKGGLVLEPLPKDSGIHFELLGSGKFIPAFIENVDSTSFATTIRDGSHYTSTIEHLLSALHAYGISNLLIKCNEEIPILDGSSIKFCEAIASVGVTEQGGDWYEIAPSEVFEIRAGDNEFLRIEPGDILEIDYRLSYPEPVGEQTYVYRHSFGDPSDFIQNIAPARTFGFMKDIEHLQKAGLAAGGRLDNFILIGEDGAVNTELRFDDEFARHKILDFIGDIFLIGRPLRAKVTASMTGHTDNINMLRKIVSYCL